MKVFKIYDGGREVFLFTTIEIIFQDGKLCARRERNQVHTIESISYPGMDYNILVRE